METLQSFMDKRFDELVKLVKQNLSFTIKERTYFTKTIDAKYGIPNVYPTINDDDNDFIEKKPFYCDVIIGQLERLFKSKYNPVFTLETGWNYTEKEKEDSCSKFGTVEFSFYLKITCTETLKKKKRQTNIYIC